jgi:hypothetical protein
VITLIHSSRKAGRSTGLAKDVGSWAEASLVTLTELSDPALVREIKSHLSPGRVLSRITTRGEPQSGECGVIVDLAVWEILESLTVPVTRIVFVRRGVWAHTLFIRHRATGAKVRVSVAHLPAGVESRGVWAAGRRAIAHRAATAGLRRHMSRMRSTRRPDAEILAADLNHDLGKSRWRTYYRLRFPTLRLAGYVPTHHGRAIDGVFVRHLHRTAPVRAINQSASDHDALRVLLGGLG